MTKNILEETLSKYENQGVLNAVVIKTYIDYLHIITPVNVDFGYYNNQIIDYYELYNHRVSNCNNVGADNMIQKCYFYYALKHIELYIDKKCTQMLDTVEDIESTLRNSNLVLGGSGVKNVKCDGLVDLYRKIKQFSHPYTWVKLGKFPKLLDGKKLYIKQ